MRRLLYTCALALLVALWLPAMVGCGTNEPDAATHDETEQTTAASPADADGPQDVALNHPADKPVEPTVIAMGETVDLAQHLSTDRITVFDFTSKYCGPCRQIAPYLDRLHKERSDVAVVKVDINRPGKRGIDWGSPVARQYGLRSIPHFKVFDAAGNLMAEGQTAQPLVFGWINELQTAGR